MREPDWNGYRWRLLEAGLGHRWVTRHVRELHDHFDDLCTEARARGIDQVNATAVAAAALGSLDLLADNVIAHARPCLLRRHPVWMMVCLPVVGYLLLSILVLLASAGLATLARHAAGQSLFWRELAAQLPVLLQLYVVLPAFMLLLVGIAVRNHCPRRYWVSGVLLLCVLGSGMSMRFSLPILGIPDSGMIAFSLSFGTLRLPVATQDDHLWRLLSNLAVAGAAAAYLLRRQRSTASATSG